MSSSSFVAELPLLAKAIGWLRGAFPRLDRRCGVKILSINRESADDKWATVVGSYRVRPPEGRLRMFRVRRERGPKGERFYPQLVVMDFDDEAKTWRSKVWVGEDTGVSAVAAIVGQPTTVLWDYYAKVGPRSDYWDFEGWPDDSVECDRKPI